jgi:hypothetical protein
VRAALWTLAVIAVLAALALGIAPSRQAILNALPRTWHIALIAWRHGIDVDHGVRIRMRDGVTLAASLYRPKGATSRLATVYVRLPYGRNHYAEGPYAAFLFSREGYAVLVEDVRGTGDSGGEQQPWRDAADDGVATLDWIARQPWSNGKVGTFGCSGLGEPQMILAARNHPAHAAMIPSGAGGAVGSAAGRYSYFGLFEGGVFELASGFGWFVQDGAARPGLPPAAPYDVNAHIRTLPVSTLVQRVRPYPNGYEPFLALPLGDPRWAQWGFLSDKDVSRVPALVINTWGDQTVGDALAVAESWRRADPAWAATHQRVVIAPGVHCDHEADASYHHNPFGELALENRAWPGRPDREWYMAWFDYWLRGRGDGLAKVAPYTYFMLGENRWLTAHEWPPREARAESWYLASGGHANSRRGDGSLATTLPTGAPLDEFRYDPANPVPTRGGPICCSGAIDVGSGPVDQADVEKRDDVLVYTSAPLEHALRIAGPLKARLLVSSDAPDTDLVARLVDVFPDGHAIGIQEGALRLRYRDGFERPVMMRPGERYDVTVDMRAIAYTLAAGHRLRLHVTSSSFPRLDRNLNTGAANNEAETAMRVATNRIYHDAQGASRLVLYTLPAE